MEGDDGISAGVPKVALESFQRFFLLLINTLLMLRCFSSQLQAVGSLEGFDKVQEALGPTDSAHMVQCSCIPISWGEMAGPRDMGTDR